MSDWSFSEITETVMEELVGTNYCTTSYGNDQLLKESAALNGFHASLQHGNHNDFGNIMGNEDLIIENSPRAKQGEGFCPTFHIETTGIKGSLNVPAVAAASVSLDPVHLVDHSTSLLSHNGQMHVDAGLSFLENNKERENDLPYYDWRGLNDFDDIDQMFSCDPTFGQNTDGLSWLSSSSDLHESKGAHNSGLPSSSSQLCPDSKRTHNEAGISSSAQSGQLTAFNQQKSCSRNMPYELATEARQVGLPVQEFKGQNARKLMGKDQISTSTSRKSLYVVNDKQNGGQKHLSSIFTSPDLSQTISSSQLLPKQNHLVDSNSLSCLPKFRLYSQSNGKRPVCEDNFVHSSNATIHNASLSPESATFITDFISKNIAASPDFLTNAHDMKLKEIIQLSRVVSSDLVTSVHDHHNNLQGNTQFPLTNDDKSMKTSSFEQLHNVMDQLDVWTKLCIRDSLYRLAKSAENGHISGTYRKRKATNRSMEHMNVETETNPIDRSIAQLLFHTPHDPAISTNVLMPLEATHGCKFVKIS